MLCPVCEKKKKDKFFWHFEGKIGCKECADNHFKTLFRKKEGE